MCTFGAAADVGSSSLFALVCHKAAPASSKTELGSQELVCSLQNLGDLPLRCQERSRLKRAEVPAAAREVHFVLQSCT